MSKLLETAKENLSFLLICILIALNAVLPGKDYEFGTDVTDGRSGDFGRY